MTKRAFWNRGITESDGSVTRFRMDTVWPLGRTITLGKNENGPGTTYKIQSDGWRKI